MSTQFAGGLILTYFQIDCQRQTNQPVTNYYAALISSYIIFSCGARSSRMWKEVGEGWEADRGVVGVKE